MTVQRSSENTRSVNSQITDAITQSNVINIGIAPSHSLATLYQTTSQAVGTAMQNAVSNQQNTYSLGLASLAQNLQSILSLSSATASRTTAGLLSSGAPRSAPHHSYHPVHAAAAPHPAQAPHPSQTPPKP